MAITITGHATGSSINTITHPGWSEGSCYNPWNS